MKVLEAAYVTKDIIVDQFGGVVEKLIVGICLGFSNDELPL